MCCCVLKSKQYRGYALRPLQAENNEGEPCSQQNETCQQHQFCDRAGGLTGEEQRKQDDGAEFSEHRTSDDDLSEGRGALTRVLEQGNNNTERVCDENNSKKQRGHHLPG